MSAVCGICNAVPSKYKCPSCQVPYCSLACYKPHKEIHAAQEISPIKPTSSEPTQAVQPPQPVYNIYNLKSNPAFAALVERHPHLKAQLAEIWTMTLPPSASYDSSAANHHRGGRQGGKFKQEKADEAAASALGRLKDDQTTMNDGLREFVKLVEGLSTGNKDSG